MTKKSVELSADELKLIEEMRAQKAAEEEAEREEQVRQEAANQIRDKFEEVLKATHTEINKHIKNAKAELQKAVSLSEKTGIPFSSDIVEFVDRLYVPKSLGKKWPDVDDDILQEFDLYAYNSDELGWEYWRTSSLNC